MINTKIKVKLKPSVIARFMPYESRTEVEIDRVMLAFIASLGYYDSSLDELILNDRDLAAFLTLHDLNRRNKTFRVERPYILVMSGGKRRKIFPMLADYLSMSVYELVDADRVALVDRLGDVVYYEIDEADL